MARLRCAACCSDAGLIGGSVGADMGAGVDGEVSETGKVAIGGTSWSGKNDRLAAPPPAELNPETSPLTTREDVEADGECP